MLMSCPENKVKAISGAPWSVRAARVRNEHGTQVRDATKLKDNETITVTPWWACDTPFEDRFTVKDVVETGERRLAENTDAPAADASAAFKAAWRAQGGTRDVYVMLPGPVAERIVFYLSNAELTEALAWCSNRDVAALARFARTDEHQSIAALRMEAAQASASAVADDVSHGLRRLSDQFDGAQHELHQMMQQDFMQLEHLLGAVQHRFEPQEAHHLASRLEPSLARLLAHAESTNQLQRSVASYREAAFKAIHEAVRHEPELVQILESEGRRVSSMQEAEVRSARDTLEGASYARNQVRSMLEHVLRGDRESVVQALHRALSALDIISSTHVRARDASQQALQALTPLT
jgi:hypothetical protein